MNLKTVPEIAKDLRISPAKVYLMVESNEIPHIRVGRKILFQPDRLHEWLNQREVPAV